MSPRTSGYFRSHAWKVETCWDIHDPLSSLCQALVLICSTDLGCFEAFCLQGQGARQWLVNMEVQQSLLTRACFSHSWGIHECIQQKQGFLFTISVAETWAKPPFVHAELWPLKWLNSPSCTSSSLEWWMVASKASAKGVQQGISSKVAANSLRCHGNQRRAEKKLGTEAPRRRCFSIMWYIII